MRRLLFLAVAAALAVAPGPTRPGAEAAAAPRAGAEFLGDREVELTIDSAAMAAPMRARLLLPRDWHIDPNLRFAVLYLLPGYGEDSNHDDWVDRTDIRQFMADENVLVVMPEAGAAGLYSDWWNHGAGGPPAWETFHTTELREVIERDWRASDRRGIAGISMGGFGAMSYAARKPGTYHVVASFSGFLHTTAPLMPQFLQEVLRAKGKDPLALWGDPIANADIWAAHDPYVQAEGLRGSALYISGGIGGPPPPLTPEQLATLTQPDLEAHTVGAALEDLSTYNTRGFLAKLDELKIPYTADFGTPGAHNWTFFQEQLHRAWPALATGLGLPV